VLTNLLDKSFNQFVALNPSHRNDPIVGTMHPQTIADLQALSAIQMGPAYDSGIAGHFAEVFGKRAVQFAVMAANQVKYPELDRLLAKNVPRGRAGQEIMYGALIGTILLATTSGRRTGFRLFDRRASPGAGDAGRKLLPQYCGLLSQPDGTVSVGEVIQPYAASVRDKGPVRSA